MTTRILRTEENDVWIVVNDGKRTYADRVSLTRPGVLPPDANSIGDIGRFIEARAKKLREQVEGRERHIALALQQEITVEVEGSPNKTTTARMINLDHDVLTCTYAWAGEVYELSMRFTNSLLHLHYIGPQGLSDYAKHEISKAVQDHITHRKANNKLPINEIMAYLDSLPLEKEPAGGSNMLSNMLMAARTFLPH